MTKLLALLAITTLSLSTISFSAFAQQPGRVKVSFAGFKCLRETNDDMLQADGKGDEIFFQFYLTMAGQNGATKLQYAVNSDIYGDATGPFSNRISAGSCTDMFGGAKGGIRAGDNFSTTKIIGEYDLAAGDVLTVVPTIWEWDPGTGFQSSFDATITGAYTTMNQHASNISNQQLNSSLSTAGAAILGAILLDAGPALSLKAFFDAANIGPKSRPIGMTLQGNYAPKAVLFNTNVMQSIANSNFGYGQGIIPVQYNEEALGNNRDHGNYIILLKVEFTSKTGSTTNSGGSYVPPPVANSNTGGNSNGTSSNGGSYVPPPNTNTGTTTAKPLTLNTPVAANRNLASGTVIKTLNTSPASPAAGTYTGTQGILNQTGPNYFAIKLNGDGSLQVLSNSGSILGTGSFSFSNNQLIASYTVNNTTNSIAATLDNTGTFTGTWGNGTSTSGRGRWTAKKH